MMAVERRGRASVSRDTVVARKVMKWMLCDQELAGRVAMLLRT